MPTSLLASLCEGSPDANPFTTSALNGTGAKALIVAQASYAPGNTPGMSDSSGNSYASPIYSVTASYVIYQVWVIIIPAVSASMTWLPTGTIYAPSVSVAIVGGSGALDQQSEAHTASGDPLQPGLITPTENSEFLWTGFGAADGSSSVSAPLSPVDGSVTATGNHIAMAHAHEIQTTATARNPTWTWGFATAAIAVVVSIKAAASGGGPLVHGGPLTHGSLIRGGRLLSMPMTRRESLWAPERFCDQERAA